MCEFPWRRFFFFAVVAQWSKGLSTKTTGAVIVREDKNVASAGFNGFVTGADDGPEIYADRKRKYELIIHCDVNALILERTGQGLLPLYTRPFMSCIRCAVVMLQAGIKNFVAPYSLGGILISWFLQRLPLDSIVNY